jgi:hypothetical protein
MSTTRFLPTLAMLLLMAGCTTHRAISPRLPVTAEGAAARAAVVGLRAVDPETIRASTQLVAAGRTLIGRLSFDASLAYRRPDCIRVRASRPVPGGEFLELIQRGQDLTVYFYKERRHYSGPRSSLDARVLEQLPVDASWLVTVPLIDQRLAQALGRLGEERAPLLGPWRCHLLLTGPGASGESFHEQRWYLDPKTLTVEALALRLSDAGQRPLWLSIVFDGYREFSAEELGVERAAVLPTEFRVSLARHPFRRTLRGERWSVRGTVSRAVFDRPIRDQDFIWPAPEGAEALPLSALQLR